MMKAKVLFLFTDKYPYDEGEQYLHNELSFLCNAFDRILLFPTARAAYQRPLPEKVSIVYLPERVRYSRSIFIRYLPQIAAALRTEMRYGKSDGPVRPRLRTLLRSAYNAACFAEALLEEIRKAQSNGYELFFYSYWFYQWPLTLSLLQRRREIAGYISRAHLGDLYPVFDQGKRRVFSAFKLSAIQKLHVISEHGRRFMEKSYPHFSGKLVVSYLGVTDDGLNQWKADSPVCIVSCSAVDKRKRVDLIVRSLALLQRPVKWIHFGHGPDLEKTRELAGQLLPSNVSWEMPGFVSNSVVREYYRHNPVNLFINLSKYEGIPVSMMEAASYGIPLAGTAIFGVPELCTSKTGILFAEDPAPEEVAQSLEKFLRGNQEIYRDNAREMYLQRFDDVKNYTAFAQQLLQENSGNKNA